MHYLIWYGRIWNADRAHEGWRPYQGAGLYKTTPTTLDGITSGHYEHVHISATTNDEVWPPPYRLQVYGAAEVGYVLEQDDRQLVPCRTTPGWSAGCRAPTCKPAASATCSPWTTGQPGITFVTGRRDASSLRLLSTAPVNTARHRSPERLLTNPDVAFADAARPLPRSSPKYLEPGGTATFPSAADAGCCWGRYAESCPGRPVPTNTTGQVRGNHRLWRTGRWPGLLGVKSTVVLRLAGSVSAPEPDSSPRRRAEEPALPTHARAKYAAKHARPGRTAGRLMVLTTGGAAASSR